MDLGSKTCAVGARGRQKSGTIPTAEELVLGAAAGDQAAWDALVERFAPTVWAIARGHRLSPADAGDVSQTTWLRLVENLGSIRQPERIGAWLATTARRESLRVLRLLGRQVPSGDDLDRVADPESLRSPDRTLVAEEQERLLQTLLADLPSRSQDLLRLLSADSHLSYRDISQALDMPIGSIGPTRARVLERLRQSALKAGVKPGDVLV